MNSDYITRALCFHGQPMQKIWEDERGAGDLQQWGVPQHSNYTVYLERQKYFTFQDRAKRLKLHQFFSRKAVDLYNLSLHGASLGNANEQLSRSETARPYISTMPPFEFFVNKNQDKFKRLQCLLEGLKPGDVIFGVVTKSQQPIMIQAPLIIKPLCTAEPLVRYLGDVTIKASIPHSCIKVPVDKKGKPRSYVANDFVCCEIVDVSIDADRLNLTMESAFNKNKNVKFGLVSAEELPEYYRTANNNALEKYNDCLLKSKEFQNPNYDILYEINGLDVNDTYTLMGSLKNPFPVQEYAKELRQTQASKWAFRSVAEGIEHFKVGRHIEAFQCLNKALHIDPRNVEGLVARGALYANKGSFLKAVDDFEKALKLNAYHVNARKYMGETLVALGRSYEDDNRIEDAVKAYKDCLNIIPNHEQARLSLEALQHRPGTQMFDNLLNIPGSNDVESSGKQKKKRQDHTSTSSSDDTVSESETNSDSDSSEKSRNQTKKDISLSPLSKRMAQSTTTPSCSVSNNRNQFSQPFYIASQNNTDSNTLKNPNDFRLDDDDTESRVRKLLQDASKYKKEKSKKSKKKKSKKSKKESRKDKSTSAVVNNMEKNNFKDTLHTLSGLKSGNKMNENLQLYEQTLAEIKKRKEILEQSTSTNKSVEKLPDRRDSPPPKAPSMKMQQQPVPPPPPSMRTAPTTLPMYPHTSYTAAKVVEPPRFSFTIKRPVKVDKFGLVRIATPLTNPRSPTKSRSRSRSRSSSRHRRSRHSHSRSRSRSRYSRSRDNSRYRRRSRSRSSSFDRRRRRRSVSRSRGRNNRSRPSRSRSRSARRRFGRRRTPSPFVPRGTPSPRRRSRDRTRTRSPRRSSPRSNFGNRVWQRPGYKPGDAVVENERWVHDKYCEKPEDGPSIEEIDEIINRAQKERKEEIIKRDKNILKKQC